MRLEKPPIRAMESVGFGVIIGITAEAGARINSSPDGFVAAYLNHAPYSGIALGVVAGALAYLYKELLNNRDRNL